MEKKARGIANWDESLRQREEFQRKCYPGIKQPEVGPKDFRNLGFSHRRCRREAELRGDPTGSVFADAVRHTRYEENTPHSTDKTAKKSL
jgi:hypothetical protein